MANELTELCISKQISRKEMVEVVQTIYSGFDKTVLSKCENVEKYGISLRPDAMKALYAKFAPDILEATKRRKGERHRLTCRISGRLETPVYEALQQHIQADGFATTQEWVTAMALRYISEKEGKAQ